MAVGWAAGWKVVRLSVSDDLRTCPAFRRPSRMRDSGPERHRTRRLGQDAAMGSGYVGILSVELHFPEAGSLKGKRKFVKSAKAQLQHRFGVAVAEVDHHELWQRSRLMLACVARDPREVERLLDDAERYLSGQEYELVSTEREVVAPGD